jgi:hypothetical protein
MKKLAILGIIGGAAILTAAPLSLQWSQKNVALSLDSAKAGTATSGVSRRVHRKVYRRVAYGTAVAGSGGYDYSSLANCGGGYLERIPLRFEHSLHGERSSCTLLPRNRQRSVRSGAIDAEWCARRPCAGHPSFC